MKLTFLPKTGLGKVSMWGIIYFFLTWSLVAFSLHQWGGDGEVTRSFLNWLLILLTLSGMLGAFVSLFGGLIAIVWREDRSIMGIFMFILSIPAVVLLFSFLLGSYIG